MKNLERPNIIDEFLYLRIGGFYPFFKEKIITQCLTKWDGGESLKSVVNATDKTCSFSYDEKEYIIKPNTIALVVESKEVVVDFISVKQLPSNLGFGNLWFWICPVTKSLCRKLYYYQGRFVGRKAIPNNMYRTQIRSKLQRTFSRFVNVIDEDSSFPKYAKRFYRQRFTPRWIKWNLNQDKNDKFLLRIIEKKSIFGV